MVFEFQKRFKCELCGSEKFKKLISKPFTDNSVFSFLDTYYEKRIDKTALAKATYEVVECLDCHFMWQAEILPPQGMELLYETWISKEQSKQKKEKADVDLFVKYSKQIERVVRYFQKKPYELNILDFGMGWGYWCLMAKAFGCNAFGLEYSQSRVDFAKSNGLKVVNNLNDFNNYFDFINAEQVFEHVENPTALLIELTAKLKPNGIIRISVPNAENFVGQFQDLNWVAKKDAFHALEHINSFIPSTVLLLANKAGLALSMDPVLNDIQPVEIKKKWWQLQRDQQSLAPKLLGTTLCFKKLLNSQ